MTAFASNIHVRAIEREFCLCVVIKAPLQPLDRDMTLRARFTEASFMRVLVTVAADAVFRGIAEDVRFMTFATLGFRVLAEKRESGQVVIEKYVFLP